jgi:hypothetical protein
MLRRWTLPKAYASAESILTFERHACGRLYEFRFRTRLQPTAALTLMEDKE